MKISDLVITLMHIQAKFGDIEITGGHMTDELPLSEVCVTDKEGMEIWPHNPNGLDLTKVTVDGVFFT